MGGSSNFPDTSYLWLKSAIAQLNKNYSLSLIFSLLQEIMLFSKDSHLYSFEVLTQKVLQQNKRLSEELLETLDKIANYKRLTEENISDSFSSDDTSDYSIISCYSATQMLELSQSAIKALIEHSIESTLSELVEETPYQFLKAHMEVSQALARPEFSDLDTLFNTISDNEDKILSLIKDKLTNLFQLLSPDSSLQKTIALNLLEATAETLLNLSVNSTPIQEVSNPSNKKNNLESFYQEKIESFILWDRLTSLQEIKDNFDFFISRFNMLCEYAAQEKLLPFEEYSENFTDFLPEGRLSWNIFSYLNSLLIISETDQNNFDDIKASILNVSQRIDKKYAFLIDLKKEFTDLLETGSQGFDFDTINIILSNVENSTFYNDIILIVWQKLNQHNLAEFEINENEIMVFVKAWIQDTCRARLKSLYTEELLRNNEFFNLLQSCTDNIKPYLRKFIQDLNDADIVNNQIQLQQYPADVIHLVNQWVVKGNNHSLSHLEIKASISRYLSTKCWFLSKTETPSSNRSPLDEFFFNGENRLSGASDETAKHIKNDLIRRLKLKDDSKGEITRGLRVAAANGFCDLIPKLMNYNNYNPDINSHNANGETPLHFAVTRGHPDMVYILLGYHADINFPDQKCNTPMDYAKSNCEKKSSATEEENNTRLPEAQKREAQEILDILTINRKGLYV